MIKTNELSSDNSSILSYNNLKTENQIKEKGNNKIINKIHSIKASINNNNNNKLKFIRRKNNFKRVKDINSKKNSSRSKSTNKNFSHSLNKNILKNKIKENIMNPC